MSIASLLNETVTILVYTGSTDAAGYPTESFADGDSINARLQPVSASENISAGRQATKKTYKVFILPTISINQTDRISYDSIEYDIVEKITYTNTYIRLVMQEIN